jgi:hypothetical protein
MKLEAQWIVGFVDGEGCFHVGISQNKNSSTGVQVLPEFVVTQHKRSIQVLYALKDFFQSGIVRHSRGKNSEIMCFRIRNTKVLRETVIPFFEKHPLKTTKNIDFRRFRKVLLFMERGDHLTAVGVEKIRTYISRPKEKFYSQNLFETEAFQTETY